MQGLKAVWVTSAQKGKGAAAPADQIWGFAVHRLAACAAAAVLARVCLVGGAKNRMQAKHCSVRQQSASSKSSVKY